MLNTLKLVLSPLAGLFILILGNSLFNTLVILRLHQQGAASLLIGIMTGVYYLGLALGSFRVEPFIVRVGHIRAFAAFASLLTVTYLLQGIFTQTWVWIVLRIAGGVATAGLFIVIESWLLLLGAADTRGKILALYMISLYAAQATGQFLINLGPVNTLLLFAVAAIFCALSIIPLVMTKIGQPEIQATSVLNIRTLYRISGTGVLGCLGAGLILGAIYGLLPLVIIDMFKAQHYVAPLMALTIFGGMLLQYPLGKLSDLIERRKVLMGVTISLGLLSAFMALTFHNITISTITVFFLGGVTFTIYPMSIAQACDNLQQEDIISGTQGLLLAYSVGAAAGPIIAPLFIHALGPRGLFTYFAFLAVLLTCYFGWRRVQAPIQAQEDSFVPMVQTTPVMSELDPRAPEEEELSPAPSETL